MRTSAILFALLFLGCSTPVDDHAPDASHGTDAGSWVDMTGDYRAVWTRLSPDGDSPLSDDDVVRIDDRGDDDVRVSWAYDGALVPSSIHVGDRYYPTGCVEFPAGVDEGTQRDPYTLCWHDSSPAPAVYLIASWATSIWRADLTRL